MLQRTSGRFVWRGTTRLPAAVHTLVFSVALAYGCFGFCTIFAFFGRACDDGRRVVSFFDNARVDDFRIVVLAFADFPVFDVFDVVRVGGSSAMNGSR